MPDMPVSTEEEVVIKTGYPQASGPGWLGPVSAIAGGLASAGFGYWNQRRMEKRAERLANTAHQREVADLRAAGLNPILSATKGFSGSDTPVVQAGEGSGLGNTIGSAARMATIEKMALMSNIGLNSAAEAAKRQEVTASKQLTEAQVKFIDAQTSERQATARSINSQTDMQEKGGSFVGKYLPRDWIEGLDQKLRGFFGGSSAK